MNRGVASGFTRYTLRGIHRWELGFALEARDPRQVARVGGVAVEVPYRVSGSRRHIERKLTDESVPLKLLLGTRHQSGYIREASLVALEAEGAWEDWLPFLLLSAVDYVPEVAEKASTQLLEWDAYDLRQFAVANPLLLNLVRARSVSYRTGREAVDYVTGLVESADWFTAALAGDTPPTSAQFDRFADCRFPYFDPPAWRSAIALAPTLDNSMEFSVLYEILTPPYTVEVEPTQRLAMLAAWAAQSTHPSAPVFLALGTELIASGELRAESLPASDELDEEAAWVLDTLRAFVAEPRRPWWRRR